MLVWTVSNVCWKPLPIHAISVVLVLVASVNSVNDGDVKVFSNSISQTHTYSAVWMHAIYTQLQKLQQTIYNIRLFMKIIWRSPPILCVLIQGVACCPIWVYVAWYRYRTNRDPGWLPLIVDVKRL